MESAIDHGPQSSEEGNVRSYYIDLSIVMNLNNNSPPFDGISTARSQLHVHAI